MTQTFGAKVTAALFALFDRAKLSGKPGALSRENLAGDMVELIDDLAAKHKVAAKAKRDPRTSTSEIDEIWLAELEQMPAYAGIDVKRELGKSQAWASVRPGTKITRRRFVNWLNRAAGDARPVAVNGAGQSSFSQPKASDVEPRGWREALLRLHPTLDRAALAAKQWADVNPSLKADVRKAL